MPECGKLSRDVSVTGDALSDYINSLLRTAPDGDHNSQEPGHSAVVRAVNRKLMQVWVENRELLVPVAQVKSVVSLQDRRRGLDTDNPDPWMSDIKVAGQIVPLYDLGGIFRQQSTGRAHALVLRGRPLAFACDRVAEILDIPEQHLNGVNDSELHEEWVQARCAYSGAVVININKIKEVLGIYDAL